MQSASELFTKVLKMTTDELYVQLPAEITKVSSDGNYVSAILHINDNDPDIEVHHIKVRHLESKRAYIYLGMKKGDFGVVRFFDRSTEAYLQSDYNYNSDDRQHSINDRCIELGFIPDKEAYQYLTEPKAVTVDEIVPNFNSDDFNTVLTEEEEQQYQEWYNDMIEQGYIIEGDIGYDYDFRGAFKAGFQPSEVGGHWVDTWKKPNHQTFSNESIYATGGYKQYAGTWNNDEYIMPESRIIEPPDIEIGLKNSIIKISLTEENITIYGDVNITGNLTVTGEVIGNGIPLSTHFHGNGNQGADTTTPKT